jgi:hypothetical protein
VREDVREGWLFDDGIELPWGRMMEKIIKGNFGLVFGDECWGEEIIVLARRKNHGREEKPLNLRRIGTMTM